MKGLLLDQGLPRSTTKLLSESGLAALHAADVGLSRASDPEILEYARVRDLIVVTLDADFHMLLASTGAAAPFGYSSATAETQREAGSDCH